MLQFLKSLFYAPVNEQESSFAWSGVGQKYLKKQDLEKPITSNSIHARSISEMGSFPDLINGQYELGNGIVSMNDLRSEGVCFEVEPAVTEARSPEFMEELVHQLQNSLRSIPENAKSPWNLQITVQDVNDFSELKNIISDYPVSEEIKSKAFTKHWIKVLHQHIDEVANGAFYSKDIKKTWKAKRRQTRIFLWRNVPEKETNSDGIVIDDVADGLKSDLEESGIEITRLPSSALYQWLTQFFNPDNADLLKDKPSAFSGDDDDILQMLDDGSFGGDIGKECLHGSTPVAFPDGVWEFDGRLSRFISLDKLNKQPKTGALTGEKKEGEGKNAKAFTVLDRLPDDSVWSMVVSFESFETIEKELEQLEKNTLGAKVGDQAILNKLEQARQRLQSEPIFKVFAGLYIRGDNREHLDKNVRKAASVMSSQGFTMVRPHNDLVSQDCFIRALPFNFNLQYDFRSLIRRARKMYLTDIVKILPFYGRSKGSGNPGFFFWNRSGEPFTFDAIKDRAKNAFMLILGPTGSGKSATLNYVIMQYLAFYNARFFVIEKGGSFSLLAKYLKRFGVNVNTKTISQDNPTSLNPFHSAVTLKDVLEGSEVNEDTLRDFVEDNNPDSLEDSKVEDVERDPLGEMLLASLTMITGGKQSEIEQIKQFEKRFIQKAIIDAGKRTQQRGYTLTEDIADSLLAMSKDQKIIPEHKKTLIEFSESMRFFCTGVRAKFFNVPGENWPDADVTIIDIGMMSEDQYTDMLGVSMVAMLNKIIAIAEANQHSGRPTFVLADEGHITATNPLLAPVVTNMTKMARKLNLWFWLATQNLVDLEASKKMLTNMEFWTILAPEAGEVRQISDFRELTEDQTTLLNNAKKERGKFTEGVVMADMLGSSLFRNVPPPIAMALAMTDPDEKAERRRICEEKGIDELQAAEEIARQMTEQRKAA